MSSTMVAVWFLLIGSKVAPVTTAIVPQASREQCLESAEYARQLDKTALTYCIPGIALGIKS